MNQARQPLRSLYGDKNAIDPEAAYRELLTAGDDWAEAKHAMESAEAHLQFVFDTLMREMNVPTAKGKAPSIADRECSARLHDRYSKSQEDLLNARRTETKRKVRWIAAQTRLDFIRTAESTQRALLKHVDRQEG